MRSPCFLLLFGTIGADQDVFRVTNKEGNPREDAFERELASWVNVSGPWHHLRVVATMTTTPRRINFIEPALDSLLQQSRPLDAVYLFVPKVFKRENTTYQIPSWLNSKLRATPELQLRRCQDWGPATHLLEVLKAERDPETAILQVDDDQHYGPLLLESLLRAIGPAPGRAIGAATQHAHTHLGGAVLEGVHGALFRRKFFDDQIFHFENFSPHCRLHDDLWISAHLARKGILREVLISRLGTKALSYGFGEDALYMGGAGSDNSKNFFLCSASLLRTFPKLWAPQTRVALVVPGAQRWTLKDFRRLGSVVKAAYVYGKVDHFVPHSTLEVPRGRRFTVGPWKNPIEVFLGTSGTSVAEALDVALNFEEDASSVIVFLSNVPSTGLKKVVKALVRCVTNSLKLHSRQSCRNGNGVAFWRHAAYPADRIGGAIFLPKYSEDFHAYQRGLWWRDFTGDWHVAATQRERFELLKMHSWEDATVQNWFAASLSMHRRVVAILSVVLAPKVVLPQLFHPPKAWRNYIAVKAHRRTRHGCVPRVSAMRFRRRILCLTEALHPLDGLLNLERWPKTLIVLTGRRRPPLESLLQATDLWAGAVIANHAYAYGKHAGPIPDSFDGILYRRSFFDARFLEDLKRPECAEHPDLVLAAHVALKSIPTEVLGTGPGVTFRLKAGATDCWGQLVQQRSLWSSVSTQRSVLHVAPLDGMDPFLLDLTLRYAATQSNKPDEIVLLTAGQRLLEESQMPHLDEMGHVEVHLPAESWMQIQVRSRGKALPVELHELLASLKDKAGCVLYVKGRSMVLSVLSCSGAACGPRWLLGQTFERELEPDTALIFSSAERLVNERLVEENVLCLETCRPHCSQQRWCGQATTREDGALSDLTLRRSAGYVQHE